MSLATDELGRPTSMLIWLRGMPLRAASATMVVAQVRLRSRWAR